MAAPPRRNAGCSSARPYSHPGSSFCLTLGLPAPVRPAPPRCALDPPRPGHSPAPTRTISRPRAPPPSVTDPSGQLRDKALARGLAVESCPRRHIGLPSTLVGPDHRARARGVRPSWDLNPSGPSSRRRGGSGFPGAAASAPRRGGTRWVRS